MFLYIRSAGHSSGSPKQASVLCSRGGYASDGALGRFEVTMKACFT